MRSVHRIARQGSSRAGGLVASASARSAASRHARSRARLEAVHHHDPLRGAREERVREGERRRVSDDELGEADRALDVRPDPGSSARGGVRLGHEVDLQAEVLRRLHVRSPEPAPRVAEVGHAQRRRAEDVLGGGEVGEHLHRIAARRTSVEDRDRRGLRGAMELLLVVAPEHRDARIARRGASSSSPLRSARARAKSARYVSRSRSATQRKWFGRAPARRARDGDPIVAAAYAAASTVSTRRFAGAVRGASRCAR